MPQARRPSSPTGTAKKARTAKRATAKKATAKKAGAVDTAHTAETVDPVATVDTSSAAETVDRVATVDTGSTNRRATVPRPRPTDAVRLFQGLAAQAAGAVRSIGDDLADAAKRNAPEPLTRVGAQITQLSTMWVAPLQAILNAQREFFEVVSAWAAAQRQFADRIEKLAESNQKVTDQLSNVLGPLLEQAEAARKRVSSDKT